MAIQFKNLVDVFEQRTGAVASDAYTLTVSTVQSAGASPNPGTGGLKVQYNDGTNDHAFGLVAGSSSSDFLTSGPMYFYTNSDLDTVSATGFAMVLDNNQRLGIGTTSPGAKLDVNGNISVSGNINLTDGARIGVNGGETLTIAKITGGGAASLTLSTNTTATGGFTIDNTTGLKFGSTSGANRLLANTSSTFEFGKNGGGTADYQFSSNCGDVTFLNSGNVGIGTSSPSTIFHIDSGNATAYFRLQGGGGFGKYTQMYNYDDDFLLRADHSNTGTSTGTVSFAVGPTDGVSIGGSGQVTFWQYGSGTFTGTATKNLAVDSSGNVIETDGSIIDGSGTANYVAKWSDPNTLTDSVVYDNGTNVGIGTSSPSGGKLHIYATNTPTKFESSGLTLYNTYTNSNGNFGFVGTGNGVAGGGNANDFGIQAVNNFVFATGGSTERMRIDSSGDVGIGTTNPTEKLHVVGSTLIEGSSVELKVEGSGNYDTANITMGNAAKADTFEISVRQDPGDNYATLEYDGYSPTGTSHVRLGGDYLDFNTAGSSRMRINSTGRVGIATTNPLHRLQIGNGSGNESLQVSSGVESALYLSTPNSTAQSVIGFGNSQFATINTRGRILYQSSTTAASNYMQFTVAFNEVMRLTNDSLGIGTTNPQAKLHVNGNVTANRYYGNASTVYYVDPNHSTTAAKLAGGLEIGYGSAGEYRIEVGEGRTGNGYAYIDFVGDTTYSDYGLRLIRNNLGANTSSQLIHRGAGTLNFKNIEAAHMTFDTSNTERMRIESGGNVGIGTTSPDVALDVNAQTGIKVQEDGDVVFEANPVAGSFSLGDAAAVGGGAYITSDSSDIDFFGDGDVRFRNEGNVGIETTNPQSKLQVNGAVQVANDTDTASAGKVGALRYRTSGNNSYVDMCMQTGASTYAWVNIVQNSW